MYVSAQEARKKAQIQNKTPLTVFKKEVSSKGMWKNTCFCLIRGIYEGPAKHDTRYFWVT